MYDPSYRYAVSVDSLYFATNRDMLRNWFIYNGLYLLWSSISRSHVGHDYIVHFHGAQHMTLFMLSFETKPVPDIDTVPAGEFK